MSSIASTFWLVVSIFLTAVYIMVVFQIVVDLFRDQQLSGGAKALWILGLLFIPVVTAVIYIVARGRGMTDRTRAASERARAETEAYVRRVAGTSSVDQIARAKSLFDSGAIDADEFAALKRSALQSTAHGPPA